MCLAVSQPPCPVRWPRSLSQPHAPQRPAAACRRRCAARHRQPRAGHCYAVGCAVRAVAAVARHAAAPRGSPVCALSICLSRRATADDRGATRCWQRGRPDRISSDPQGNGTAAGRPQQEQRQRKPGRAQRQRRQRWSACWRACRCRAAGRRNGRRPGGALPVRLRRRPAKVGAGAAPLPGLPSGGGAARQRAQPAGHRAHPAHGLSAAAGSGPGLHARLRVGGAAAAVRAVAAGPAPRAGAVRGGRAAREGGQV